MNRSCDAGVVKLCKISLGHAEKLHTPSVHMYNLYSLASVEAALTLGKFVKDRQNCEGQIHSGVNRVAPATKIQQKCLDSPVP